MFVIVFTTSLWPYFLIAYKWKYIVECKICCFLIVVSGSVYDYYTFNYWEHLCFGVAKSGYGRQRRLRVPVVARYPEMYAPRKVTRAHSCLFQGTRIVHVVASTAISGTYWMSVKCLKNRIIIFSFRKNHSKYHFAHAWRCIFLGKPSWI